MRRDLCYFYPVPVQPTFDAFVQAANQQFGKGCKIDAYKTISFGLNYSLKYNMNGGTLTVHFMPYNNGTAVDLRYTVVQLAGARYKKHAQDLTLFVDTVLRAQAQPIQLDINEFLAYEAGVPSAPMNAMPPAQPMQQPVQPVQPAPERRFCTNCGSPIAPGANFCTKCGAKLS